jgi:hypothetical protein
MKPSLIVSLLAIATLSAQADPTATSSQTALPAPTAYAIAQQDGNSRIWQRTEYEQSPAGQAVPKIHKYTELATGLNHLVNGRWVESKEEIDIQPDGTAAATNGQHQAYFPANIYNGEIEVITPDGRTLDSCPALLCYIDGTNSVVLADLQSSTGELVASNQVVYPNAFNGLTADLRYTYRKSGLEQDVVLREQPPSPESLGLNPKTTRLEMLTEFFGDQSPAISSGISDPEDGLVDKTLAFGQMHMIHGKAFSMGNSNRNPVDNAVVFKDWLNFQGQTYLIEKLPLHSIAAQLQSLPVGTSSVAKREVKPSLFTTLAKRSGIKPQIAKAGDKGLQIAKTDFDRTPGLVLDYALMGGYNVNYTFQGDTTYYMSQYYFGASGNIIIEGGTVIKFATNMATCQLDYYGTVTCDTSPYRPAIFTSVNDDSVGEILPDSNGNPTNGYGAGSMSFFSSSDLYLHDLRMSYMSQGFLFWEDAELDNVQIVNCGYPIEQAWANITLNNVLFYKISNMALEIAGGTPWVNATQVTAHDCSVFANTPQLSLVNCLMVNATNLLSGGGSLTTNYTAILTNDAGIFQTVGGGGHYLASGSPYHGAGATNISSTVLAYLADKTTYPPIVYSNAIITTNLVLGPQAPRDTNSFLDLGYHYDPLDYVFGGCTVSSNLTFTAGTDVGWFRTTSGWYHAGQAIQMSGNITVAFNGTVTSPDYWVRLNTVQENDQTAGYGHGSIENWAEPAVPVVSGDFLHCTAMAGEPFNGYFADDYGWLQAQMANSEFWSGDLSTYGDSMFYTNCLFWRLDQLGVNNGSSSGSFTMRNCTMIGGEFFMNRISGGPTPVSVRNCAFDGTTIATSDYYSSNTNYTDYEYNAYTNNPDPFAIGGSHDVIVTNFNWQSSWFGDFYLPSDSPLIDAGSATADQVGLYHFTTQTNQVKEGTSYVDIDYHYVATDTYGNPLSTYTNGVPDYIEDSSGNGIPDWWQLEYFGYVGVNPNADPDGNGYTIYQNYQNGTNPTNAASLPLGIIVTMPGSATVVP